MISNFNYTYLQFLLENHANPNALTNDNWTPLHSACKWNHVECVEKLLEAGTDINALTKGGKIIIIIITKMNLIYTLFIINIRLTFYVFILGMTPLHLAAEHQDSCDILELLLSQPNILPNVKLSNSTEDTPRDIAGRKSVYERFFEYCEPCFNYI